MLIELHYPKPTSNRGGRLPLALETKLRIYCLQQFYDLSDPGVEEALDDSEAMRRFAGIEWRGDAIPDESTLCKFRHLLERHRLTEAIFPVINQYLSERGLVMRQGSLLDAGILHAPSSTKDRSKQCDPQMSQTKKGQRWYFGMKAPIGVDLTSGLVQSVLGTTAKAADSGQLNKLLHGKEHGVLGDGGYHRLDRTLDTPAPAASPRIITPFIETARQWPER